MVRCALMDNELEEEALVIRLSWNGLPLVKMLKSYDEGWEKKSKSYRSDFIRFVGLTIEDDCEMDSSIQFGQRRREEYVAVKEMIL
ncbi:hypothetical protein Tco_0212771 [Tanacetum coccineum]